MLDPEVWFAIPSASVDRCRANLPAWRDMGYRIAVLQNHQRGHIPADITVWSDHYPGWPASVNLLATSIVPSSAAIVVTGGDDTLPDPNLPAHRIARQFLEHFPDSFGVMQPTGDTFMNSSEYCGSPWLGRAWITHAYNAQGPLHPHYHHNWADHELLLVAKALGRLCLRDDLTHKHLHFTRDNQNPPDYWTQSVAPHDRADVQRFIARRWLGFPGHEPTNNIPSPGPHWFASQPIGVAERYWAARYAAAELAPPHAHPIAQLLRHCREHNITRVAIYGAGTELRSAAHALMDPGITITTLIDDDPRLNATRLWGFPIIPLSAVDPTTIDAIIIAARTAAPAMANRCRPLAQAGVRIITTNDLPAIAHTTTTTNNNTTADQVPRTTAA